MPTSRDTSKLAYNYNKNKQNKKEPSPKKAIDRE